MPVANPQLPLGGATRMPSSNPLSWRRQPAIRGYGTAVLSVAAALLLSHLQAFHLESAPVSLFLCGVMFSAWFAGVGPGLLATVLSALAFYYCFLPPAYSLAAKPGQAPRFFIFVVSAVFVGSLSAAQRRATESLRRAGGYLKETVQELQKTNVALSKSEAYLAEAQILSHTGSFGWNVSTGNSSGQKRAFTSTDTIRRSNPRCNCSSNGFILRMFGSCRMHSTAPLISGGIWIWNIDC